MGDLGCWWWWLLLGTLLGWLASWWLARRNAVAAGRSMDQPIDPQIDPPADAPVERVVETVVEKLVDNPVHLKRIQDLEAQLATMTTLRVAGKAAEKSTEKAPEPAAVRPTVKIMDRAMDKMVDHVRAGAAGYSVRGMDHLEIIAGISPKGAELFRAAGIRMFWELAQTPLPRMQEILRQAGPDSMLANPSNLARQASLAANNQWSELRQLQDELEAGIGKSGRHDRGDL